MFYIDPPKGQVALHILENCVLTRLEYLRLLEANDTDSFAGNVEYLLENSLCDSIGHFILRLIAATSTDLWPRWVKTESLLLQRRLDHLSARQVRRLFSNIVKHLKRCSSQDDGPAATALMEVSTHFLKPPLLNHITGKQHETRCRKYRCTVPFASVPDLVRKRRIDLCRGQGTVFCSDWKVVLLSLFGTFVTEDRKNLLSSSGHLVTLDPRLRSLRERIHSRMFEKRWISGGNITARNIDAESAKFPLCMRHLHSILREKHRLSHHARFHYSLFLKECGMKLDDAIDYWKQEYSKPHECQSGCTHSWQSDERKFLYSIRHLYGLEGGRKNYKTPNCKMICSEVPGLRYEGGCPFKNFDADTLGSLLKNFMDESEIQERLKSMATQTPEAACSSFLKVAHKRDDEAPVIHSPVQYYTRVTESK